MPLNALNQPKPMSANNKDIEVYAHWIGMPQATLMGRLNCVTTRGREVFSFEYDNQWLKTPFAHELDPDLGLYTGRQYLRDEKSNFGIFLDSSPDRWGRMLMKRREAITARLEGRKELTLQESDFLLGVYDEHRMGALRFKLANHPDFLSANRELATPPWTSLRELEQICLKLEDEGALDDPEYLKWINMLIAPGSSLGGARPKASVLDPQGALWIAKFPSKHDADNTGGWEMVVNELGKLAGVNMADGVIQKLSSRQHTFLSRRFDRTNNGGRIHFASAMTLLGYTDGIDFHDGVSYLELAEFIIRNGANVEADLLELFRRILFSICVSNTDDHLRNHGFLLTHSGWVLSPAYDINPNPYGTGLKLNISENDNSLSLELAMSVAPYFRLNKATAQIIIDEVVNAVSNWREVAKRYGMASNEIDRMQKAFENYLIK